MQYRQYYTFDCLLVCKCDIAEQLLKVNEQHFPYACAFSNKQSDVFKELQYSIQNQSGTEHSRQASTETVSNTCSVLPWDT